MKPLPNYPASVDAPIARLTILHLGRRATDQERWMY